MNNIEFIKSLDSKIWNKSFGFAPEQINQILLDCIIQYDKYQLNDYKLFLDYFCSFLKSRIAMHNETYMLNKDVFLTEHSSYYIAELTRIETIMLNERDKNLNYNFVLG
jgi:hypothetical protein